MMIEENYDSTAHSRPFLGNAHNLVPLVLKTNFSWRMVKNDISELKKGNWQRRCFALKYKRNDWFRNIISKRSWLYFPYTIMVIWAN